MYEPESEEQNEGADNKPVPQPRYQRVFRRSWRPSMDKGMAQSQIYALGHKFSKASKASANAFKEYAHLEYFSALWISVEDPPFVTGLFPLPPLFLRPWQTKKVTDHFESHIAVAYFKNNKKKNKSPRHVPFNRKLHRFVPLMRLRISLGLNADWFGHSVPLRKGSTLFSRTSLASVPSSIKSSLVMTPMVLWPETKGGDEQIEKEETKVSKSERESNLVLQDPHPVGQHLWPVWGHPSWPGPCLQAWQPGWGSFPGKCTAWSCLWSGIRCLEVDPLLEP